MNILILSIKQKHFDDIASGVKKIETREIRPNNFSRYCRYLHKGTEYINADDIPDDDADIEVVPVKYDAVKLLTGKYTGKRPYLIIEIKDSKVYFLKDENDEEMTYEIDGKTYIAAEIDYELGDVIEKSF
ncbi:MAG: ASCH domain-containing protein [Candidatus Azobacteroides sp.]|nr:ASCH domain-containing protein [Candidatus Azobacteroides sp.]